MPHLPKIFTLSAVIASLFYFSGALKLPFGQTNEPGPGFFPLLLGAAGIILSVMIFGQSLRRNQPANDPPDKPRCFFYYLAAIIGMALVFEWIGSLIGVFLFVLLLLKISGAANWKTPVTISLAVSFAIQVVFGVWLKVSLPAGVLTGLI